MESDVRMAVSRVAKSIQLAAQDERDPERLKTLAEAVAQLRFGPQGGDRREENSTEYSYAADVHNTSHPGEPRARPAGFANGASST